MTKVTRRSRFRLQLDTLEDRLAPAMLIGNPATASYTDVDGDLVTVKVSTGSLAALNFTTIAVTPGHDQLQKVDFSAGGFDGANLTFSVVKVPGGDGLANVGYINSTGHDLGKVTVKGDLGQIDAGDGITTTPGLKALSVRSLGRLGTDTQGGGGTLVSDIAGALGALKVAGDVKDAFVSVAGGIGAITIGGSLIGGSDSASGQIRSFGDMGAVKIGHDVQGGAGFQSGLIDSDGKLAGVSIGGSLIGGSGGNSGEIFSGGNTGAVRIGHDVLGGSGNNSGYIECLGKLAGVSIGGSLIGGSGVSSGEIFSSLDMGTVKIGHDVLGGSGVDSGRINGNGKLAGVSIGGSLIGGPTGSSGEILSSGDMGAVKIAHDVQGGAGFNSGFIYSNGKLAGVSIGGSLIGGSNTTSGAIFSILDMGAVKIGHDLTGGSITGSASLDRSGVIETFVGRIASVTIGGSIISGIDSSSDSLTKNASIRAANDIGSLTVKGSLIGNFTADGASPVIISARGQAVPGATTDLAIGKITIGGRVEFANILAGYNAGLGAANGDAQIGTVMVGGDWAASNLVAGAMNAASSNTKFGNAGDASIGVGSAGIIAKILSIKIAGQVFGTAGGGTDHFGFVAQQIGAVNIGGSAIVLATGANNDNFNIGATSDLTVHEI